MDELTYFALDDTISFTGSCVTALLYRLKKLGQDNIEECKTALEEFSANGEKAFSRLDKILSDQSFVVR